jgi:acetoacetyl-CoA synthetase
MQKVAEGALLWEPTPETIARSNLTAFLHWLSESRGLSFKSYDELWRWSVSDLAGFWSSVWDFFEVGSARPPIVIADEHKMPGAHWFEGANLNYAQHALRRRDDHLAIISVGEDGASVAVTYAQLWRKVGALQAGMRRLGVRRGDRVVAYMPNIPDTLAAFLAAAGIGAIWSSCSPDFGTRAVVDRFQQIEPTLLLAVDGYRYGGKEFDRLDDVAAIESSLPTLKRTVIRSRNGGPQLGGRNWVGWDELEAVEAEPSFEQVPFDHPLWILYSSGTTGLPKGIVHGHGGILLEHLKALSFHFDLQPTDRLFWFTTTGWMMWNLIGSSLLLGATLVQYDGSPAYPDIEALWRLVEDQGITIFGTSATFLQSCVKAGLKPRDRFDLSRLRSVQSTGAPLSPEGFQWVMDEVGIPVHSSSGGTDVCSGFLQACPLLPVYAGELQCRALGVSVEAFDPTGHPLVGQVGELVITKPMPSMPLYLWNDPDGSRYRESYFSFYPGVWRHGDWIKFTERGSAVIYGRSDSTLNRGGVRMGTSDFYRVVEELPEIQDSLVVDLSGLGLDDRLLLFVVLGKDRVLDEKLVAKIRQALRSQLSPRHVPDEIHAIPSVPRTLNGKKLEIPVKRILLGERVEKAVNAGAVSNPDSLAPFLGWTRSRPS